MATGDDVRIPNVQGKRPPGTRLLHKYMNKLHHVAGIDPVVCRAFFVVGHFFEAAAELVPPGDHAARAAGKSQT